MQRDIFLGANTGYDEVCGTAMIVLEPTLGWVFFQVPQMFKDSDSIYGPINCGPSLGPVGKDNAEDREQAHMAPTGMVPVHGLRCPFSPSVI